MIAGLMDNRVTDLYNKVPWLGDVPILGNFFKSKSAQKSNSELMVLCTVRKVTPNVQCPKGPTMPEQIWIRASLTPRNRPNKGRF